jgi:SAM-dependent methyltransferase
MMEVLADGQTFEATLSTVFSTLLPRAGFFAIEILLFVYLCYTVAAIFRGAAPIPTRKGNVKRILALSKVQPGELVLDLGSGDGRILRAAAARGAQCVGFEINPFLCWYSRLLAWPNRSGTIVVERKDFWSTDLSKADVVTVYLVPKFMERLKNKVLSEMRIGARVVVAIYPFSDWIPDESDGKIYLYVIK